MPRVHIEYDAPTECPREQDFIANLRQKIALEVEDSRAGATRAFAVTLRERSGPSHSGYRGRLRVHSANGSTAAREVTGAYCGEVAEAIAVIIAIELGPEQRERRARAAMPARETRAAQQRAPTPTAPAPPQRAVTQSRWRWGGVGAVAVTSGVSDGIAPEIRGAVALRRDSLATFSPEFRVGFAFIRGPTLTNRAGSLELRVLGMTLEGCPLQAHLTRVVSFEPCAKAVLGMRQASGGPPSHPNAETERKAWLDVGGLTRLVFSYGSGWLDLSGEVFAVLVHDRFYTFSPNIALFDMPHAGARVALGVGVHFD